MIAVATISPRSIATREAWSDPRRRVRILCGQILAAERKRVDRLVRENLHVLQLTGRHFARITGLPREDVEQAAFFGLRRAAETFDPTRGASFASWAYTWQRATVQEEMFRMRSTIRVPRRSSTPIPKVSSFDAPARDDGSTIGALLADEDASTPADLAHRSDMRECLIAVLGTLAPRDRLVIELRYGLGEHRPLTYVEIGERLGVCGNRARQIEARVFRRLRDELAAFAE